MAREAIATALSMANVRVRARRMALCGALLFPAALHSGRALAFNDDPMSAKLSSERIGDVHQNVGVLAQDRHEVGDGVLPPVNLTILQGRCALYLTGEINV